MTREAQARCLQRPSNSVRATSTGGIGIVIGIGIGIANVLGTQSKAAVATDSPVDATLDVAEALFFDGRPAFGFATCTTANEGAVALCVSETSDMVYIRS